MRSPETLFLDGGAKSGSGTIVRCAVALCSLLRQKLHIVNIRARRQKPGLQHQHLKAVQACAQMCGGKLSGASLGSREITYEPGERIAGGRYEWDIGTAGSTTMLAMATIPLACFASGETTLRITGGLFQDFAPSAHHMEHVLLPLLERMGVRAQLTIVRPGYVPRGGGVIEIVVRPVSELRPIVLLERGGVLRVRGIALSSHLREAKVSERMAETCRKALTAKGYAADIDSVYDDASLQPGASLAVWAETEGGCLLGADRAGARGRTSEAIGRTVAAALMEDIASGATVDRHVADQLILYSALARGISQYVIPNMTEHVETNLWLVEQFGAKTEVDEKRVRVEGIGHRA
ncbi:MAG: RNA 3'-phosphate cyclase [Chloroflexi bacterium]|nr:RNA 3'-phosphate cyclase [Chloroflexota bacterium]